MLFVVKVTFKLQTQMDGIMDQAMIVHLIQQNGVKTEKLNQDQNGH